MKIVKPSFEIETVIEGEAILQRIERAGRTCYKSTDVNTHTFVRYLVEKGHHSVLEHESITVRIICDRGISHEIVRHRLASYSQESTRYCTYSNKRFGGEITVIDPRPFVEGNGFIMWKEAMEKAERMYFALLGERATPQIARSVLPNSLKTEIVMTCNLREWRHFFVLRTASTAHPQMRQIACPLLAEFRRLVPVVFDDVGEIDASKIK